MYERLTKRVKPDCLKPIPELYKEYAVTIKNEIVAFEGCFDNKDIYEDYRMALDRLCEIEDKIEQGKIVELPCAVGDTLFGIYHSPTRKNCVFEYDVTEIVYCSNRGVRPWVISCFGGRKFDNCDFGKTVFLDRAAAEAKLREMEGENNE